jgi:hypothetical protein
MPPHGPHALKVAAPIVAEDEAVGRGRGPDERERERAGVLPDEVRRSKGVERDLEVGGEQVGANVGCTVVRVAGDAMVVERQ